MGKNLPTYIVTAALLLALAPPRAFAGMASPVGDLSGVVICLDPGHPSETSEGTESKDHSLTERHVNWIEANDLLPLLTADGATVVFTKRSEREMVTNRHRAEIANAAHAILFLRLHCDSAADSGISSYYPDRTGRVDGAIGPSAQVRAVSKIAATAFQQAAVDDLHGKLKDRGLHGDSDTAVGQKQGALTGSVFSDVPAVTVEMCVLTNPHDFAFIRTKSGQASLCHALLAGIRAAVLALKSAGYY